MPLGGATTNQTLLLALLARCRQAILKEIEANHQVSQDNATATVSTSTTSRRSYDNAYFYILFVMFFYSFLALTLFKGFVKYDKDSYEEFMSSTDSSKQKYNTGPVTDKIDFEEEISI